MRIYDTIRLFGLNNLSIESEIRRIELQKDVDLGHRPQPSKRQDQTYYPQFSQRFRDEAEAMASHYAVFYCLENSIRDLVKERLEDAHGENWWEMQSVIPENVKKNAESNRRKELRV